MKLSEAEIARRKRNAKSVVEKLLVSKYVEKYFNDPIFAGKNLSKKEREGIVYKFDSLLSAIKNKAIQGNIKRISERQILAMIRTNIPHEDHVYFKNDDSFKNLKSDNLHTVERKIKGQKKVNEIVMMGENKVPRGFKEYVNSRMGAYGTRKINVGAYSAYVSTHADQYKGRTENILKAVAEAWKDEKHAYTKAWNEQSEQQKNELLDKYNRNTGEAYKQRSKLAKRTVNLQGQTRLIDFLGYLAIKAIKSRKTKNLHENFNKKNVADIANEYFQNNTPSAQRLENQLITYFEEIDGNGVRKRGYYQPKVEETDGVVIITSGSRRKNIYLRNIPISERRIIVISEGRALKAIHFKGYRSRGKRCKTRGKRTRTKRKRTRTNKDFEFDDIESMRKYRDHDDIESMRKYRDHDFGGTQHRRKNNDFEFDEIFAN
jgi:hypothetical protein